MNQQDNSTRIIISVLLFVLFVFGIVSCRIQKNYPKGDFYAVIVSDTHISRDESKIERLNKLSSMINTGVLPKVEFVVNTGDVVSRVYGDYRHSNPDSGDNRLRRAVTTFSQMEVPWYFAMGNHDYKIGPYRDSDTHFPKSEIDSMEVIWKRETGFEPYYSFDHNGWRFIVLNSMRGRYLHRHFDDDQMSWLKYQLSDRHPAVLFFHHPMETDNFTFWAYPKDMITEEIEPEFYNLLKMYKKNIKGIFVGHGHRWVEDILLDQIKVYESNSFGDEDELMYYVVGFDTLTQTISVATNVVPDTIN
jgi:3',5'-cyclic AMP phosphodiesterase CpdA